MAQSNGAVAQNPAEVAREKNRFGPQVDIFETGNEVVLYADLPGMSAGDIEVLFEKGELTLRGRAPARTQPVDYLLQEFQQGNYLRVFHVHEHIDSSRIEAELKNGVLTVRLPKEEKAKPWQVAVKGA